jgi:MFS family permease
MVFAAMQGLTYPLLALMQQRAGGSSWAIGLNAAMMPVGLLAAGPLAPPLIRRAGGFQVIAWSLAGSAVCLLAISGVDSPAAWLLLRFAIGFTLACAIVVADTWINELSPPRLRARTIAAYCAVLAGGFAVGPALLLLLGTVGVLPFVVGAALPVIALLALVPVRDLLPAMRDQRRQSIRAFMRHAPLLVLSVAVVAFADQTAMTLFPIYALREGLGTQTATLLLLAMIAGATILLYPIGLLADRWSSQRVMLGCAAATAVTAALLPAVVHAGGWLLVTIFLCGGTYYAIYALALTAIGERYEGATLVAANAAFGVMWGIGGLLGTPLTGAAMRTAGPSALPVILAAVYAVLAIALMRE